MFTKNFWKICGLTFTGQKVLSDSNDEYKYLVPTTGEHYTSTLYPNAVLPVDFASGNSGYYAPNMKCVWPAATPLTSTHNGVAFGNGTTPPTIDDYKLSGERFTTFSYSVNGVTREYDDTGETYTCMYTLTNTGSEEFTVAEIGMFLNFRGNASASHVAMVERTVLDEPITIPAGGVGVVTYTIRFNYPTA